MGGGEGDPDDVGEGVLGQHRLLRGGEEKDGEAVGVGMFLRYRPTYCEGDWGVEGDGSGVLWRGRIGFGKCGDVVDGLAVLSLWDSLSVISNGIRLSMRSFERDDSLSSCCVKLMELSAPDRSTWSSALSSEVSNRALLSRPGGESGFVTS